MRAGDASSGARGHHGEGRVQQPQGLRLVAARDVRLAGRPQQGHARLRPRPPSQRDHHVGMAWVSCSSRARAFDSGDSAGRLLHDCRMQDRHRVNVASGDGHDSDSHNSCHPKASVMLAPRTCQRCGSLSARRPAPHRGRRRRRAPAARRHAPGAHRGAGRRRRPPPARCSITEQTDGSSSASESAPNSDWLP